MGCVYILVNEAMPGLVKIGQTSRTAEERAGELLPPTGVPCPFEVACALYCEQYKKLETDIHKKLNAYRVNTKKEFFRYPVNDAIRVLKRGVCINIDNKIVLFTPFIEIMFSFLIPLCEVCSILS